MSEQDSLLITANRATLLGNRISLKMVQFLNEVKNQPAHFRDLGLDFLGICQILNSLESTLQEHFRSNQPFPQQAIPELTRILVKTLDDFAHLEKLLQKFMDFERGGTFAMLQKTWRLVFADKDIALIGGSLQENRGALKMTMLLTNINPTPSNVPAGYEYTMLATKLEHQGSGSPVQTRPVAPPPAASPTISELHSYDVPRPLPGPPPGPPPNWSQQKPALPQRKTVAESMSAMSSPDPDSPSSQGILTPSISEMSISDRAPEPSIVSTMNTSDREIQTPAVEEKIAIEEPKSSRIPQPDSTLAQGPPRIHIDRSTLRFRVPKQNSGASNASLKSALISAVTAQKSKIVEQLLDRGVPPDTGPEKNALCIATNNSNLEILKLLLEFGGDPNLKGADSEPPLHWACRHNHPAEAKLLLEWGGDPNISTPDWSLLPWALNQNKEDIVLDLLLYGCDPNLIMANGWISLRYACDRDVKASLVQLILDYGGDPNLKDSSGETSLPLACYRNKSEIVAMLLASGADPNLPGEDLPIRAGLRNPDCMRLLISAGADFKLSKGLMELAVYHNAIEVVKLMLDAGVDPNEKKDDYYSPLTTAIRDNHSEMVTLLLSRGADPHQKGEGFPLTGAVRKPEILKKLLAGGANVKTYQGLMELAALANNLESAKILLDAGVPIDEKHQNCYTALTTAARDNRAEMVAFLLAHGADPNLEGESIPLAMAVSKPAILKQLLEGGADITRYKGLIEYATYQNSRESIKILLDAGESINQKKDGLYTPLTTAIRENKIECLAYLLSLGADPNAPGEGLPLNNASKYADPERLKMLLDAGADVNRALDSGRTALMTACEKGLTENVKLLMDKGADIDLADENGKTAMDFAVIGGHDELVMVLLEAME